MAPRAPLHLYLLFHLNLAYSSIDFERHAEVVQQCYWPILRLAQRLPLVLGVELTAHTLESIQAVDAGWVETFRDLLARGRCELVGSGDSQLIGPLVPAEVNRHNLALGQAAYRRLLGVRPRVALVNEQVWSRSLADLYLEAGYEGVIMEWDNPYQEHPDWDRHWGYLPQYLAGENGRQLPLIWNHSIAFQKFQRYAHGETTLEDYLDYLGRHQGSVSRVFPVYGNDAEIFDFRPGRYHTEARLGETSEWARIERLLETLASDDRFRWCSPSGVLELLSSPGAGRVLELGSCRQPVPVKKQPKYNLSRWAVTGRDDLWLNSLCHRICQRLQAGNGSPDQWRRLCRAWASDLRTHMTPRRWDRARTEVEALARALAVPLEPAASSPVQPGPPPPSFWTDVDEARGWLRIEGRETSAVLDLRRGLALRNLAFTRQDSRPLLGTVEHGYFEDIRLGADFYTGPVVMELPREHRRLTDLAPMQWHLGRDGEDLVVEGRLETTDGVLVKRWRFAAVEAGVEYEVCFPGWSRPQGVVRVGHFTLAPDSWRGAGLRVSTLNGGDRPETFVLDRDCRQGAAASTLVSARAGLGATTGWLGIQNDAWGLQLQWDPARCAAFPMLEHLQSRPGNLTRVLFSLSELDETHRAGGRLLPFRLRVAPWDGQVDSIPAGWQR